MEHNDILEEFIILPRDDHSCSSYSSTVKFDEKQSLQTQSRQETNTEFVVNWTTNQTKVLLDIYKQYRSKVGSYEVKNLKKLWEIIANKINEVLKTNFTANHVENRWRVVARSSETRQEVVEDTLNIKKKWMKYLKEKKM